MAERFNVASLHNEVTRLVRSNTREILDCPEALRFLIGDKLDAGVKRDIKVLLGYTQSVSLLIADTVPLAMGTSASYPGYHILREALRQRPSVAAVCSSRFGTTSGGPHFLLCPASRASIAV